MTDYFCSFSDVVVHTDRTLAKFSTSPYDHHDLERMLNVVKDIEGEGSSSYFGIALISRT